MKRLIFILGMTLLAGPAFAQGIGLNGPGIGLNGPGVGLGASRYRLNNYPYGNPYGYPAPPAQIDGNTAVVGQPTYYAPYYGMPGGVGQYPQGNYPSGNQNDNTGYPP